MRKLVDTADVQGLIEAERQRLAELSDRCRAQLLQIAPEALDHICAVVRNPKHPKCLDTSRFVVEKVLPARTMLEADVKVGPSQRDPETQALLDTAVIEISSHLQLLREARAGRSDPLSRVRSGAEALPRPSLPGASTSNGSSDQ